MNFLSHYYLHRNPADNDFTVGLTIPDLLGFHSSRVRVTENFLTSAAEDISDPAVISCFRGMIIHLKVDRWFHGCDFFKEQTVFIKEYYTGTTGHDDIPHHISHILLEILLDRHLLSRIPNLADNFYESYKIFDFNKLINPFSKLKNFDADKFITLTDNVTNSNFLNDYIDPEKIIGILQRVSGRIGFPLILKPGIGILTDFIEKASASLDMKIKKFFIEAKNIAF